MLAEILLHTATRTAPWIDQIGYRKGAVRLWSRAVRCRTQWAAHLAHTHAIVTQATEACPGNRTALVFGSGLLADLPLAFLAAKFARVELVDVVHLPVTRWRTRLYKNIRHVVSDLSGVAEGLVAGDIPVPGCRYGLDDADIDFVVSLNLISQLPLAPIDWLMERRGWTSHRADSYGAAIVAAHLTHLRAFQAPVCLIGDLTRVYSDPTGAAQEPEDALFGVPAPVADAQWDWDLAPLGEIGRDYAVRNRVFAVRNLTRIG